MDNPFGAMCDDFYVSTRLFLKLDIPISRETTLHFFDRIRREFPSLSRFRRRDDGSVVLEEVDADGGSRRWIRLEEACLRFGHFSPPNLREVRRLGQVVLSQAPYHLTFSDLDYDHLETVYGFDLEYRGNHDQLVAETFFEDHPLAALLLSDDAHHTIDCQPYFGIALRENCDLQAYVEVKSRTTTYEVRTGDYESQPLSIFLTVRKYWGFSGPDELVDAYELISRHADDLANERVVPVLVNPLAQAIASRP